MIFHDVNLSLPLSSNIQVWLKFTGSAKIVDTVLCPVKSIQVLITTGHNFTKQKICNKVAFNSHQNSIYVWFSLYISIFYCNIFWLFTGIFVTFQCYVLEIMSYVHHRSNFVYSSEVQQQYAQQSCTENTWNNSGKNNNVFRDCRNLSVFQRNMLPPSSWRKSEDWDRTFLLNVRKLLPDSVATIA
jgi:hypothetical protein